MPPRVKLTASMAVAIAATEVTFWLLSYIPMIPHGFRELVPSLLCDAGLVYMLKYITDNHYSVRRWQEAVRLAVLVSMFYMCIMAPSYIYGFGGIVYVVTCAINTFLVIIIMLLSLVYVKI